MKGKLLLVFGMFLLSVVSLKGEEKDSVRSFSISQKSVYPFIIQDSPALVFTMRQIDEDYLSGYRIYSRILGECFSPAVNYAIQAVTGFLFLIPLTHEEAPAPFYPVKTSVQSHALSSSHRGEATFTE